MCAWPFSGHAATDHDDCLIPVALGQRCSRFSQCLRAVTDHGNCLYPGALGQPCGRFSQMLVWPFPRPCSDGPRRLPLPCRGLVPIRHALILALLKPRKGHAAQSAAEAGVLTERRSTHSWQCPCRHCSAPARAPQGVLRARRQGGGRRRRLTRPHCAAMVVQGARRQTTRPFSACQWSASDPGPLAMLEALAEAGIPPAGRLKPSAVSRGEALSMEHTGARCRTCTPSLGHHLGWGRGAGFGEEATRATSTVDGRRSGSTRRRQAAYGRSSTSWKLAPWHQTPRAGRAPRRPGTRRQKAKARLPSPPLSRGQGRSQMCATRAADGLRTGEMGRGGGRLTLHSWR